MNDEETKRILDRISPSFCGAKWYNATIWLGSGMTTSCHHPPAHKVSVDAVKANPKALHNTPEKFRDREMMQQGKRPAGCDYCWKIEDMDKSQVSDRIYKSKIYTEEELNNAARFSPTADTNLRTLEIAFDRTCNFACSYCNPAFSTTWVKDIKKHGPYEGLESDGRNHFTHEHNASQLYKVNEENPYVEAFFKWWDSDLSQTLQELRVTGGEPLMSRDFWRLLDWFKDNNPNPDMRLAVNSNLGGKPDLFLDLVDRVEHINHFHLYTSCEAVGEQAEYIRDGLKYTDFNRRIQALLAYSKVETVHVMCTINGLCLTTLVDFLNQIIHYKGKYGRDRINFTLNILRFPSFQSVMVMPIWIRQGVADRLLHWLELVEGTELVTEMEVAHVKRLIVYLDSPITESLAENIDVLRGDFKRFYTQYDQRRNKNFVETFPSLEDWYESIG